MLDAEPEGSNPAVGPRILRQFAAAWLIVFLAFAAHGWFGRQRAFAALACLILALGVGALGLARPMRVRPLFELAVTLSLPVGWVMTRMVTMFLFFVVFTPLGWLFRLFGRDFLGLRRRRNVSTYWKEFPASDVESYFRQSQ